MDNIRSLCTKDRLILSLRKFYAHCPDATSAHYSVYDTTPTTFIIQSSCTDHEFQAFLQKFQELASHVYMKERIPPKHCAENVWLIKPCAQNQGTTLLLS